MDLARLDQRMSTKPCEDQFSQNPYYEDGCVEEPKEKRLPTDVDSIAIFGILSIPIFRIGKDMVFPPFGKRYFLNVIEFSGLMVTG